MDAKRKRRDLSLNLEKVPMTYLVVPKSADRVIILKLEKDYLDLFNLLLAKKNNFHNLSTELSVAERGPRIFKILSAFHLLLISKMWLGLINLTLSHKHPRLMRRIF